MLTEFFFSILLISPILTGNFISLKSYLLSKILSTFLNLAGWWSAECNYHIKHHLKHWLPSKFWILTKPFLGGLIIFVIWYNCYQIMLTKWLCFEILIVWSKIESIIHPKIFPSGFCMFYIIFVQTDLDASSV